MKSLKLFKAKHICRFYDSSGKEYIGQKRVSFETKRFNFDGEEYFFIPQTATVITHSSLLRETKYYIYHEGNPEPLLFEKNYNPKMTSKEFNVFINTTKLEELNNLHKKNSFWDFITNPKFFIPAMVIVGLIYWYYHKQGKI